jgi:transposase InsO family protein
VHLTKGRYADKIAKGTKLNHDHGSQFISHDLQDELKTLGIESSPSQSWVGARFPETPIWES